MDVLNNVRKRIGREGIVLDGFDSGVRGKRDGRGDEMAKI